MNRPIYQKPPLQRIEQLRQVIITKGEGRIHVTDVRPPHWTSYIWDPNDGREGRWWVHEKGTGTHCDCARELVPPNIREMAIFAKTW